MFKHSLMLFAGLAFVPGAALAANDIEVLLAGEVVSQDSGDREIALRFLNLADQEKNIALPDRIEARIESDDGNRAIMLIRAPGTSPHSVIAAHGFTQARYRLPAGDAIIGTMISIPSWSTQTVRLASPSDVRLAGRDERPAEPTPDRPLAAPPPDRSAGNAFLDNLSAYEPIYAVYGPGTNSDARIQLSFKYQLFRSRTASRDAASWRDGLHFAYTQRMFWDLGAKSSPFRNIDYQPELIYITPSATLANGISLAAQAGVRHESNGRDGAASRSINSLYVAPMAAIPIAGHYSLTVIPQLSVYIGDKSDNPDIARYRGHAGLFMEVGEAEGLRFSTSTRFNFGSGKGAINADLSYPLPRLLGGGPDVYLFAQSFHGYGENLLDYDRRISRLRIGLALVR